MPKVSCMPQPKHPLRGVSSLEHLTTSLSPTEEFQFGVLSVDWSVPVRSGATEMTAAKPLQREMGREDHSARGCVEWAKFAIRPPHGMCRL